jgi:hypothetical protein
MAHPTLDAVNTESDGLLSEHRQQELASLGDHVVGWEPNRVAVERPNETF